MLKNFSFLQILQIAINKLIKIKKFKIAFLNLISGKMVVRREKKRRRGERTYHGKSKRWRGKGSRGGRGKAGLDKHKWTYTVKYAKEHFGKRGFKSIAKKKGLKPKAISLRNLNMLIEKLEKDEKLEFENGRIKIDLIKLGYDKIIGGGKLEKPLTIITKMASEKAKLKIEEAGGKLILVSK